MKILLLTPPVLYTRHMPLGSAYLKAYLERAGHEVRCRDLNTEIQVQNSGDDFFWAQLYNCRAFYESNKPLFRKWVEEIEAFNPSIVGFTVWKTTLALSLKLALMLKLKNPKRVVVFGGYLASTEGKQLFDNPQLDAVVLGEGEETLLELVRIVESKGGVDSCRGAIIRKNGVIIDGGSREEIKDLASLPIPDFSDFDPERYTFKNHIPISFHRGCSWRCAFCTTMTKSWKKFRSRKAIDIYNEILFRLKQYPKLKQFEVCDPAFNQNVPVFMELCDLIIAGNHKLKFAGLAQIRKEMDIKALKKAKEAGFHSFHYGIESASQKILDKMGKQYTVDEAERVVRDTYNAGIKVMLNFIVGFPGEDESDFQETLKFIERNRNYIVNIASAHECDIQYTAIAERPESYGVKVPILPDEIRFWKTIDGTNTFEERDRRKQVFDGMLSQLGIPATHSVEDRNDYENSSG